MFGNCLIFISIKVLQSSSFEMLLTFQEQSLLSSLVATHSACHSFEIVVRDKLSISSSI